VKSDIYFIRQFFYQSELTNHHHQPINVPTAGAQAFLMYYLQGEPIRKHQFEISEAMRIFHRISIPAYAVEQQ
jgi:hypothetical protein